MIALMPSDVALIASLVRGELAKANVTARQVADHTGLPAYGVGRRLRGEVPFRADELLALSRLLGVPVERFYNDGDRTLPGGFPAIADKTAS